MPKFKVTLVETVFYKMEVEAIDEDEAALLAEDVFVQADDSDVFFSHVSERTASDIEKLEE